MHIRWMIQRDTAEILAIEKHCGGDWTSEELYRTLGKRNVIGMVIEDASEQIVGFMVYELHPGKLQVIRLSVALDRRREGIGRKMVAKLASKLSIHRRQRMEIEVRESNMAALLFLRRNRFLAEQVIRGEDEDTILMAYCVECEAPVVAEKPV